MTDNMTSMGANEAIRRRAIVALLGLLVIVSAPIVYVGMMSNRLVRSSGWPVFLLAAVGAGLLLWSVSVDRRLRVFVMTILGLLLGGLYVWAFLWHAQLPESDTFASLEVAPAFSLPDHAGAVVRLDELTAAGPALLVFFRGHW